MSQRNQRRGEISKRPVNDLQAGAAIEVRGVVSGDGEAFAKGDAGNEHVHLADQYPARFEVSPDVGGNDGGLMGKLMMRCDWQNCSKRASRAVDAAAL